MEPQNPLKNYFQAIPIAGIPAMIWVLVLLFSDWQNSDQYRYTLGIAFVALGVSNLIGELALRSKGSRESSHCTTYPGRRYMAANISGVVIFLIGAGLLVAGVLTGKLNIHEHSLSFVLIMTLAAGLLAPLSLQGSMKTLYRQYMQVRSTGGVGARPRYGFGHFLVAGDALSMALLLIIIGAPTFREPYRESCPAEGIFSGNSILIFLYVGVTLIIAGALFFNRISRPGHKFYRYFDSPYFLTSEDLRRAWSFRFFTLLILVFILPLMYSILAPIHWNAVAGWVGIMVVVALTTGAARWFEYLDRHRTFTANHPE